MCVCMYEITSRRNFCSHKHRCHMGCHLCIFYLDLFRNDDGSFDWGGAIAIWDGGLAIYGGVIVGFGCGLMLRYSATTGGTELAARLLKLKFPGLSIGTLCLSIDAIVVISYAAVFRDLTQALYAMVALFIISKVMDRVVYGGNGAKMAYIISEQYEAITAKLLELDRGVTLLEGRGGFSGSPKNVILCAFSRAQIVSIKSIVKQADPDAFIIVCDAYEILGEGFGVNRPDGL